MTAKNEFGLSPKQELFAQRVAAGESNVDAYNAVMGKGKRTYSTTKEMACKYAKQDVVHKRIIQIQTAGAEIAGVTASRVIEEIAKIAFSDISAIADGSVIKLPDQLDLQTRAAVASFEINEFGNIKYKFWDKNAALEKLAKHLGLFEKDNSQKPAALVGVVELVPLKSTR